MKKTIYLPSKTKNKLGLVEKNEILEPRGLIKEEKDAQ